MEDQEYLREQIYNSLNLRDTEDLIDIWQAHDTDEWTDLAFEVVKNILQTRLGKLPSQEDVIQDQFDTESESPEEALPEDASPRQPGEHLICPYCRSDHVLTRAVELRDQAAEIVLKKPELNLARFMGVDTEYEEIVGFACEDCGYVFFMLKNFI